VARGGGGRGGTVVPKERKKERRKLHRYNVCAAHSLTGSGLELNSSLLKHVALHAGYKTARVCIG
jgi:hypothetical protein